MRDQELDRILREVVGESQSPCPELVERTKKRLRGQRLVLFTFAACLAILTVGWVATSLVLLSPKIELPVRVLVAAIALGLTGGTAMFMTAARTSVASFFRQLEVSAGVNQ